MDNEKKLQGMIDEVVKSSTSDLKSKIEEYEARQAKFEEEHAKEVAEYRAALEKLQNKKFKSEGGQIYKFAGYDTSFNKNFKACLDKEEADKVAKYYLDMANGKAVDFASEMPVGFGSTILGLAELSSSALSTMRVQPINTDTFKAPVKATRETADSQAHGTARAATSITAATVTWTLDQKIGSYVDVLRNNIRDANVDIINSWVIPMQAEAIGQYVDAEVFNGTNSKYTTSVIDVTAAVTASGVAAIAAAITYTNLNTMFYHIAWERGIMDAKWYGSRAALKDISALTDTYGQPIFQQVPINGRPSQTLMGAQYVITPTIANAPANGAMRLCFGDPNQYIIATRGDIENLINPYILMKEDTIQFIANFESDGNVADNATASGSGAFAVMSRIDS
jgi:HK97 family phage major capsid protein